MTDVKTPDDRTASTTAAELMGRLLKGLSRTVAAEAPAGLRAAHLRLLTSVPPGGTRITELSERLGMTKQATGQFVAQLETSGHLEVHVAPDDRRARVAVRTPSGDVAVRAFSDLVGRVEASWADAVGPARWDVVRQALATLVDATATTATGPSSASARSSAPGGDLP